MTLETRSIYLLQGWSLALFMTGTRNDDSAKAKNGSHDGAYHTSTKEVGSHIGDFYFKIPDFLYTFQTDNSSGAIETTVLTEVH